MTGKAWPAISESGMLGRKIALSLSLPAVSHQLPNDNLQHAGVHHSDIDINHSSASTTIQTAPTHSLFSPSSFLANLLTSKCRRAAGLVPSRSGWSLANETSPLGCERRTQTEKSRGEPG